MKHTNGLQLHITFVWMIRALSYLYMGVPYLSRVHINCLKQALNGNNSKDKGGNMDTYQGYMYNPNAVNKGVTSELSLNSYPGAMDIIEWIELFEINSLYSYMANCKVRTHASAQEWMKYSCDNGILMHSVNADSDVAIAIPPTTTTADTSSTRR